MDFFNENLTMKFYVYILKSEVNGQYYVGQTQALEDRLQRHNQGKVKSTAGKRPWILVYHEIVQSRSQAIQRERQIKNWKSRKAIERLMTKAFDWFR